MKKSLGALLVFGVIFLGAIHTASAFTVADLLQKVQALKSEVQTLGSNLSAAAVNSTTSATTRTTSVQAVEKLSTQLDTIESTIKTALSSELAPAVVSPITADTIIFSQDLKSGVKSEDVVKLQDFLKAQGYFQGTSTGLFGPKTVESLKLWQNLNGINPTGVFDAKTRAVVNSLRVKAPASTDKPVPGTGGVNDCVVNSFTATPNPTTVGTAVTISWSTTNCTNAVITNVATSYTYTVPAGSVANGSVTRTFTTPGTYAFGIRASGAGTFTGKSVSIVVNPVDPWTALCADGQPHIQVLSPNGGETYTAGQQVTVKWKSCNIFATAQINIGIVNTSNTGADFAPTINDGQETINIGTGWAPGLLYKVKITSQNTMDLSDNLFTINGSNTVYACNDGIDNDGDGKIDMNDPGCASATDNDEYNNVVSSQRVLLTPIDNKLHWMGGPSSRTAVVFNHLFKLKNTSTEPIWIKCEYLFNKFSPSTYPTSVTGIATNSCTSTVNIDQYTQIVPNQEIVLNKSNLFQLNGPDHFTIDMNAEINKIKYKDVRGQEVDETPQNHPQFQSSWSLATPTVSVVF